VAHTYKIMEVEMLTTERPLTFSDGERIVDVLECKRPPGTTDRMRLTVLVELPEVVRITLGG
jgi:hypothetical protein